MPRRFARTFLSALACLVLTSCGPSDLPASAALPPLLPEPVLIHVPGIAGELPIDRDLVRGLVKGGVANNGEIVQWVGDQPGLPALGNIKRNKSQAALLAERIVAIHRADARTPIILTAHSGGTGIAVWALEDLPPGVRIDTLVMLASALSPDYDLSKALSHTRTAINLYSAYDGLLLDVGTKTFGTIDRKKVTAAGFSGFIPPALADAAQYEKLRQFAHDPAWNARGNYGDHIGPLDPTFAETVLAPLISGPLPVGE